ncbi:MAG: hypothetical protein AB7P04_13085 [Bacteriovoracia bacterium]
MEAHPEYWKKCNSCKNPIGYRATYWVCNVSTCNRKRTGLSFCTVACWDAHVPMMNHRESWAVELQAPTIEEWKRELSGENAKPRAPRRTAAEIEAANAPKTAPSGPPRTILRRPGSGPSNDQ